MWPDGPNRATGLAKSDSMPKAGATSDLCWAKAAGAQSLHDSMIEIGAFLNDWGKYVARIH